MRRTRRVVLLIATVALLISCFSGIVAAYAEPGVPEATITTRNDISDQELSKFVDEMWNSQLTVEDTLAFLGKLNKSETDQVIDLIAQKLGMLGEDLHAMIEEEKAAFASCARCSRSDATDGVSPAWVPNVWNQDIPKISDGTGRVAPYNYISDQYGCDDNPDYDWTLVYAISYNRDPDGLKWHVDDSRVAGAIYLTNGDYLKGFSLAWDPVYLCIGAGTADLAGGIGNVFNHVFLVYRP